MMIDSEVARVVRTALDEDLGLAGDLTSAAVVPSDTPARADLVSREHGVLSGCSCVTETFAQVDPDVRVEWHLEDGDLLSPGDRIATLIGPARSVLSGERVALNLLGRLSGIATTTRRYINQIANTPAAVTDTRKTTPGLRALEKRAVVHGGGVNHRFGLHDAIMVKDNHIGFGGGLAAVLKRLADEPRHLVAVEIEVDTLDQLSELLAFDAERLARGERPVCDAVLLDNMSPTDVAAGVRAVRAHPAPLVVEVSGGVTLSSIRALAEAGPNVISVGALTHSAPCLDVGLDLAPPVN